MKVEPGASVGLTGIRVEKIPVVDSEQNRGEKQRAKYIWRCEVCGRCLCSKRSYSEHKNTHNAARPFKCESCDYAAASQMTLRRHTLRQHVPRSHWHYPCPYCDQAFVEPTSYQAHLRHKHAGYSGTFGCDKCDYKTLSSKNFVDHIFKHAHVRAKKRPASKSIKDFTDREMICKCLVDDELGVGWGQRLLEADIDEQTLSLRRLASSEQERSRRQPLVTAVYSTPANQHQRSRAANRNSLIRAASSRGYGQNFSQVSLLDSSTHRCGVMGLSSECDHEYQAASMNSSTLTAHCYVQGPDHGVTSNRANGNGRRRMIPLFPNLGFEQQKVVPRTVLPHASSIEQGCPVPEAECYIEVATASEVDSKLAVVVEDGGNDGSSSSSGSGSDNDDDSVSCSSDNSVEIRLRLNALTAGIDMEAHQEIATDGDGGEGCQDLGNDVLPDGQVDFDLD